MVYESQGVPLVLAPSHDITQVYHQMQQKYTVSKCWMTVAVDADSSISSDASNDICLLWRLL